VSPAEDTVGPGCEEPSQQQRLLVAVMETKEWLPRSVKVAEGMPAMLTWNLVVSADLANGTQGTVEKRYLNSRENVECCGTGENIVYLQYPPAVVLFRPDRTPVKNLEGLLDGTIPIKPSKKGMEICYPNSWKSTVHRKQLPITATYAFIDYKAQGQTLQPVIVDIRNPPSGGLNAFNAYVAISQGRSCDMLRLLHDFNSSIFTKHPNVDLAECNKRLEILDKETEWRYARGGW
jgi:hypothetical protein